MIAASDMASVPVSRGLPHLVEMASIGIRKDLRLLVALAPVSGMGALAVWRWQLGASTDLLSALIAAPLIATYLLIRIADAMPSPSAEQLAIARQRLGTGRIGRGAKWVVGLSQFVALALFMTGALYLAIGLRWVATPVMLFGAFTLLASTVALLVFSLCLRLHHRVNHAAETVIVLAAVLVHVKSEDLRQRLNAGVAAVRFY